MRPFVACYRFARPAEMPTPPHDGPARLSWSLHRSRRLVRNTPPSSLRQCESCSRSAVWLTVIGPERGLSIFPAGERPMRRREFITMLGGEVVAGPLAARTQEPAMPVVGFLRSASLADATHLVTAFR